MNTIEVKYFKFGDSVVSKKIGPPIIGSIVGQIIGVAYSLMSSEVLGLEPSLFQMWEKLYPGWRYKMIYHVYVSKACRIVSFDEFQELVPHIKDTKLLINEYKKLPELSIHSYPQQDLEKYDE
jgi:hypothetical protein